MNVENKINLKGLIIWLICVFFYVYEFLLRTMVGTFQTQLVVDLNLTPVTFSLLSATGYLVIYGLMQIPVGFIADRFGLKKVLFIAVIFCAGSTMCFALSHQFAIAMLCRVCMGFGSAFGFICLLIAVYDWMPRKNIALFIGISQFIATLGPMLAAGPLNSLSHTSMIGWRGIFFCMTIIGVLIATLTLLFVENNQNNQGKFIILVTPTKISASLLKIISQKQIWYIALFSGLVYFSMEYFSENLGVEFLIKKGLSPTFSSYMITFAWLGYALGCPLLGFISDKMQRRKSIMLLSASIGLIAVVGIIYFPLGNIVTGLCFVLMGISASGQSIAFAVIAEQCKENYLAVGLGFNNAMIAVFSAVGAPLVGSLISNHAQIQDYQKALFIMVVFSIGAIIISTSAIKETFGKSMKENMVLSLSS